MRKFTIAALLVTLGAVLTVALRRRNKEEIDLWREATSGADSR